MTKKNLSVEATYRVLGRELTHSEALELHKALGSVLNIQPAYQYWPYYTYPRTYYGGMTTTSNSGFYGQGSVTNLASLTTASDNLMEQVAFKSDMVEVIEH